jgi:glycerol uptake facilitator-like aquaporin
MRKWRVKGFTRTKPEVIGAFIESALLIALSVNAFAQTADGNNGINQANTLVRGYFDAGTNLMYAVGAVLGLIGAVKVYQKWNHGDHDTGKVAAAWFGSCIFLVIVATVIKSFFGL